MTIVYLVSLSSLGLLQGFPCADSFGCEALENCFIDIKEKKF